MTAEAHVGVFPRSAQITRAGVMERFWRRQLEPWAGLKVCVNAGDRVVEGRFGLLPPQRLQIEFDIGSELIEYDDIIAVELL
jgi:hypothetical protein